MPFDADRVQVDGFRGGRVLVEARHRRQSFDHLRLSGSASTADMAGVGAAPEPFAREEPRTATLSRRRASPGPTPGVVDSGAGQHRRMVLPRHPALLERLHNALTPVDELGTRSRFSCFRIT
ncbi:hypothetical protein [Streptomyces mirabilis]|uniref:hypothetical protein n=1 Tax=Streptomyces mirabilis TaxID=68239 RepID=UPI0009459103|nr:hypothetical protein [Streptomyces mirabilis]